MDLPAEPDDYRPSPWAQASAQSMYAVHALFCEHESRPSTHVVLPAALRMQLRQATEGSAVFVSHKVMAHCV
jgi:hypothetical protein